MSAPVVDGPSNEAAAVRTGAPTVELIALTRRYGDFAAVNSIDLAVQRGEFMTLLGPSGSGKTTTLQLIAGFIEPTGGRILIDGVEVTDPPHRRDIGMVFQHYALFPHMTVAENVGFPLKMRRVSRDERAERVGRALAMVGLSGEAGRRPAQLSGGQQQRVALARALVFEPRVVLLDEPLGALDQKLRSALQLEIRQLQRELGITMIAVTHDQHEALVMSDRIAVFDAGRIVQVGTGRELYEHPVSSFVADFIGESNMFEGRLVRDVEAVVLVTELGPLTVPAYTPVNVGPHHLVVRPADVVVRPEGDRPGPGYNALAATVRDVMYVGGDLRYDLVLDDGAVVTSRHPVDAAGDHRPGDRVLAAWPVERGAVVSD